MSKSINKFAFLVHEPSLYDHWKDIWHRLDRDEFVILLMEKFRKESVGVFAGNVQKFMDLIQEHEFPYIYVQDLLASDERFNYVISNHVVSGTAKTEKVSPVKFLKNVVKRMINVPIGLAGRKRFELSGATKYISLRCGLCPIRIMYGADISDGWSLAHWNEQYRAIFCHGPNDEKAVRSRFDAEVFQMGYPRYDRYFNSPVTPETNSLFEEFSLSHGKQTIVWLPTLGEGVCSIPYYARHIARLMDEYNVVVRPHPISFREEPANIELLESMNFTLDRNDVRDMTQLYALADIVICDYGGTSFSALYLDKKIVQVNVPGAETFYTSANSSNMELREIMSPVVDLADAAELSSIIADKAVWENQVAQREVAFRKYFAPYRGESSQRVVDVLRQLKKNEFVSSSTPTQLPST
ncbi:MAG TPA: hypothetical protein EYG38_05100 [Verrucomicrobia bacterium]|nr:hypothetical protein [Verrucomicrobiota bacterium]